MRILILILTTKPCHQKLTMLVRTTSSLDVGKVIVMQALVACRSTDRSVETLRVVEGRCTMERLTLCCVCNRNTEASIYKQTARSTGVTRQLHQAAMHHYAALLMSARAPLLPTLPCESSSRMVSVVLVEVRSALPRCRKGSLFARGMVTVDPGATTAVTQHPLMRCWMHAVFLLWGDVQWKAVSVEGNTDQPRPGTFVAVAHHFTSLRQPNDSQHSHN